jgi:citronellol/citronellal dehydrogenase
MGTLDGQVALVTGSSRGIGHFMACEFAREGCNIVVAARSEEVRDPRLPGTIHSVVEELVELGVEALPFRLDVTDDEQIEACAEAAIERFGRIDILVNNAGVMAPAPVVELPVRRFDLVMRVNVRGPFAMTQAVLPQMLKLGSGTVITVSSVAADRAGAGNISYSMSKVAIEKFMEGLAAEVGDRGIRCFGLKPEGVVLSPGATYHGLTPADLDTEDDADMGRAAIWLATSDDAAALNGQSFYSRALLRDHPEARAGA